MIAFLRGTVAARTSESVILDVGGVGYEVTVPTRTRVGAIGDELTLYTYLHVREDGMSLFGFESIDDRAVFQLLLTVSGIGPKIAVGALSHISPLELRRAVAAGDVSRLVTLPGIGKKTAQRIILELKDKIGDVDEGVDRGEVPEEGGGDAASEAMEALVALGYSSHEARRLVASAIKHLEAAQTSLTTDSILRAALARAVRK